MNRITTVKPPSDIATLQIYKRLSILACQYWHNFCIIILFYEPRFKYNCTALTARQIHCNVYNSVTAFRQPSTTCSTSLPAQHLWLSGLLSRRPHSLELYPGFYPGPHHQCRLFQTFAKNVFVRSILVHSARLRFSTITALYKSTYLLTLQHYQSREVKRHYRQHNKLISNRQR